MNSRFFQAITFSLLVVASAFTFSSFTATPPQTKIMVIRHAESLDGSCATGLTEKGSIRAELLSDLFRTTEVAAIYHCNHVATKSTVQALAASKGINSTAYEMNDIKKSLFKMYSENQGKTIVICGDDSTVAEMLSLLTGTKEYSKISSKNIGEVFVVQSSQLGKGEVKRINYAAHLN
jgi:phosphohistidine phosphatase SixA